MPFKMLRGISSGRYHYQTVNDVLYADRADDYQLGSTRSRHPTPRRSGKMNEVSIGEAVVIPRMVTQTDSAG
jgi:hypothetical protein